MSPADPARGSFLLRLPELQLSLTQATNLSFGTSTYYCSRDALLTRLLGRQLLKCSNCRQSLSVHTSSAILFWLARFPGPRSRVKRPWERILSRGTGKAWLVKVLLRISPTSRKYVSDVTSIVSVRRHGRRDEISHRVQAPFCCANGYLRIYLKVFGQVLSFLVDWRPTSVRRQTMKTAVESVILCNTEPLT